MYIAIDLPWLLMVVEQTAFLAISLALVRLGTRIDTNRAMMAMTTNSSIRVKAFCFRISWLLQTLLCEAPHGTLPRDGPATGEPTNPGPDVSARLEPS